uniref:Uncharacterized protein n=1 Tax=Chenopodium quinoa TaxID=63459 RepID=A0A803M3V1_CHEQI
MASSSSTQHIPHSAAADTLSRLLHRLPPNLSLPTRLSPRGTAKSSSSSPQQQPLPTLSLSSTSFSSSRSSFELGYFQLTHHSITPQLAESAESDSRSLFELPLDIKLSSFPDEWPLGFNNDNDDDEDDDHKTGSFCLDGECSSTYNTELSLASLRELTRELEKVGLEVVEKVASAVGLQNPFRGGEEVGHKPKQYSTLMWVSSTRSYGEKGREVYPYVVGLQYQIRARKLDLLSDSGSVIVEPMVGSVLVTLGDIAQVWSNGKLKKVRGRPAPVLDDANSSLPCISMTVLLTLPLESTVSPFLNIFNKSMDHNNREKETLEPEDEDNKEGDNSDNDLLSIEPSISTNHGNINDGKEDRRVFNSFSFEDYAWRVYHERLHFKDPLDRYRVID